MFTSDSSGQLYTTGSVADAENISELLTQVLQQLT